MTFFESERMPYEWSVSVQVSKNRGNNNVDMGETI